MIAKLLGLLAGDKALGLAGGGMAVAAASFGVYMNVHGPAPGALGAGHDFTVFAQLAPRAARPDARPRLGSPDPDEDLDTTATASIPRRAGGPVGDAPPPRPISPSVTLEAAAADGATIAVAGQTRVVHVGDTIPGAGEVLAIQPGPHPSLRTSQGLILGPDGR